MKTSWTKISVFVGLLAFMACENKKPEPAAVSTNSLNTGVNVDLEKINKRNRQQS